MPRAGEGAHGGPAKFKHGWVPVNPEVAAAVERIRTARANAKPGPKGTPMEHTRVLPALANTRDYRNMTPADKVQAAEIMYGTGSRQHKEAIARFTPEVAASMDRIRKAGKTPRSLGSFPPRNPDSLGESVTPNVAELTAEARGGGQAYSADYITPDGQFTPERQALHRQIIEDHLRGITPTGSQPVQYMNGGGPGSGKSTLRVGDNARLTHYPPTREVDEMTGDLNHDTPAQAVLIDPDAVKIMLPEVKAARTSGNDPNWAAKSHEESSYLAKRIHQAALDRGLDLVYDGTGDSGPRSVENKVAKARQAGYRLEANYIYLDPKEGMRRAGVRAQRTGRHVNEQVIKETYTDVANTFDTLAQQGTFDVLRVFDNNQVPGVPAKPIAEFQGSKRDIKDPVAFRKFLLTGGAPPK